ncbi:S-adenosyl-L-methionine-dependent methyltransferase [Phascolomyces articulosus]|uniref:S-adenosyl-L-methionine-dependent methyltransferase n=1 Tax=Phascolomyces articulosus TaxID=60185 RepID=A0AAD5JLV5_9FUNG|nr:S-adenosyl-L-methionine-dependent methyltransferase [Phascolomyces articulosus]
MGNQTSRVLERTKEKRGSKTRRRSTATVGARSHSSLSISHASSSYSHGNYDWVEPFPSNGAGAIDNAMAAAASAVVSTTPTTTMTTHTTTTSSTTTTKSDYSSSTLAAPSINTSTASSTMTPQKAMDGPRRKSISEVLHSKQRKASFSRPTATAQEDFREYDRLQRQHYLLKSARKTNAWAPIEKPTTIVDIGTANGIWALEMAAEHFNAQVIGIDIKPPMSHQVGPKNLSYVEADINDRLPLEDASVDFIFQRSMGNVIRKDKWSHVLQEMLRVLKPGGYIELVEADLWHHNPGPVQNAFDAFMQEQCTEWGLDFVFTESLGSKIEETGFENMEHRPLDIPIGEWPKDAELKQFGFINKETRKLYLRNRKTFFMGNWGISSEDYDMAVQEVLEEFEDYHGFTRFNCWIARKP